MMYGDKGRDKHHLQMLQDQDWMIGIIIVDIKNQVLTRDTDNNRLINLTTRKVVDTEIKKYRLIFKHRVKDNTRIRIKFQDRDRDRDRVKVFNHNQLEEEVEEEEDIDNNKHNYNYQQHYKQVIEDRRVNLYNNWLILMKELDQFLIQGAGIRGMYLLYLNNKDRVRDRAKDQDKDRDKGP